MFCQKCGQEIQNEDGVCLNCGETITKIPVQKPKKAIALLFVLLVGMAILFAIFNNRGINSSPEKVAIATVESEYGADIDKMIKCFPEFRIKELADDFGLDINASKKEITAKLKADYANVTPAKVENAKAVVVAEYDAEDYTIARELYDYLEDNDLNAIKKVAKVEVYFEVDGESEEVTLICIKMKNKWYFLSTGH